ncbi:MAG TPA: GTP cyclohydrolase I [Candidatus Eisenbacteria bacterium]
MSPKRGRSGRSNGGATEGPGQGGASARGHGPDVAALDQFLRSIGIDPRLDPEYAKTAELAAAFLAERTAGLREEIRPLQTARYRGHPGETVALEVIPVYGLCPHHLAPYFGEAQIRYAPRSKVAGPSSIARLVRDLARIPRIQESLTQAIADHLERALEPGSVEVIVRARHLCAEMRGVEQRVLFVTEARRAERG